MKASQWVRSLLSSFAAMSLVGVMAALACAPAVPASQSGSEDAEKGSPTETPIPTATPYPDDCVEFKRPDNGEMMMVCLEPGPRAIEQDLRQQYNALMAEKELAAQEGRRSMLGPIVLEVQISTSTTDAVDDVLEFLEANGARNLAGNPDSPQAVIFLTSITDVMMGSRNVLHILSRRIRL